jgi:XapX domain-containing protein
MNYLISLAIGLFVGVIYGALTCRPPRRPSPWSA